MCIKGTYAIYHENRATLCDEIECDREGGCIDRYCPLHPDSVNPHIAVRRKKEKVGD